MCVYLEQVANSHDHVTWFVKSISMQRSSAQDASPKERSGFDKLRCNSRGQRETGFEVIFNRGW